MTYDEVFLQGVPLAFMLHVQQRKLDLPATALRSEKVGPLKYKLSAPTDSGSEPLFVELLGKLDSGDELWRLETPGLGVGSVPAEVKAMLYEKLLEDVNGLPFGKFVVEEDGSAGKVIFARCYFLVKEETLEMSGFFDRVLETAARGAFLRAMGE